MLIKAEYREYLKYRDVHVHVCYVEMEPTFACH